MRPTFVWIAHPSLLSQQTSRRNAFRAAQICRQRRLEQEAVARYLQEVTGAGVA